ncbi:MAG TPA: PaaI family thioesterase [Solirubrobacterales bacterium]|nr:PaaI family thioesterase [Solirubrobacterales bacterium]
MAETAPSRDEFERQVGPSRFDELLETEWVSDEPGEARVRVDVRDDLRQPFGLVHGGVLSSLVESVCSRATARAVHADGKAAMGQSITVSFLRPVRDGRIEVTARARHRGSTTWIWQAEVADAEGRLCALAQMTMAVRSLRA